MKACAAVLLLCGLAMVGCGHGEKHDAAAPSSGSAPLATWTIKLRGAQLQAGQAEAPAQILADQPAGLTATVTDASGKPVAGADVEASLKMKTMDMGDNKSKLSETEPGIYTGKATFTMAGPWEVEVRASKDGLTAIERFPYDVKDKPAK